MTGLLAVACAALALAGCNANVSGTQALAPDATANFAGGPAGSALPSAIPASSAQIAGSVAAATGPAPAPGTVVVEVAATFRAPDTVPEPVPRPDLGDRVQLAATQPAATATTTTAATAASAPTSANPASPNPASATPASSNEGVTQVAQAPARPVVQPRRPAGLFGLFGAAPADPAAGPQDEAGQRTAYASVAPATDARAQRASLAAYERREAGDEPPDTPAAAGKPQQKINFTYTPAVIEVNGVTNEAPTPSSSSRPPALLRPVAAIANTFGTIASGGAYGGRRWRPAYPHVVTHCFSPTLRRALDVIGDHFNADVLVTSGMRANGRRRSMHRSCAAADIKVVGVNPGLVARYARSVPGINGVGTYRRVAVTHVDTRANRMAWRY